MKDVYVVIEDEMDEPSRIAGVHATGRMSADHVIQLALHYKKTRNVTMHILSHERGVTHTFDWADGSDTGYRIRQERQSVLTRNDKVTISDRD